MYSYEVSTEAKRNDPATVVPCGVASSGKNTLDSKPACTETARQNERVKMTTPKNHNKPWTPTDNAKLRTEAKGNTPTRVIGLHMGRTPSAVQSHAADIGVSLKPTNQSPYGTSKK